MKFHLMNARWTLTILRDHELSQTRRVFQLGLMLTATLAVAFFSFALAPLRAVPIHEHFRAMHKAHHIRVTLAAPFHVCLRRASVRPLAGLPGNMREQQDRDVEIPIIAGLPQRQGDVIVIPQREGKVAGLEPIPAEGIPVVRGESGGNTHLLIGAGLWAAAVERGAVQGTLVVEDQPVYLAHPEHGYLGIGPGSYIVSRQREQAEELRLVAD